MNKYLKNQEKTSSVKKNFNFASIEGEKTLSSGLDEPKITSIANNNNTSDVRSGQITGKFRSLNEHAFNNVRSGVQSAAIKSVDFGEPAVYKDQRPRNENNRVLPTEDDYCETLTASSEGSPLRLRPSQRVQRATKLTTKAYLEDVNKRVA